MLILPCLDSPAMADARRRELSIHVGRAAELGRSALAISRQGWYLHRPGHKVDIHREVAAARAGTRSFAPDAPLGGAEPERRLAVRVQVTNETTLGAARRLINEGGSPPLALNFANGLTPGGSFLDGARAQEETLCRSSALYLTLEGDPMYDAHREAKSPASSDWVIYSPDVPVFRADDGALLEQPWPLSFLTCAAPYAPAVGAARSIQLMRRRFQRVLAVARAMGHTRLVLGAWGCGAFGNDPRQTARDFRKILQDPFAEAFTDVVFAISDWSPERRTLGAFRDAFPDPEPDLEPDPETKPARTRPANADDWRITPMPDQHVDLPVDRRFSAKEMQLVRLGVIPAQMEDKWFIYWDHDRLHMHRSWTGTCVYIAQFVEDEAGWRMVSLRANGDLDQYARTDEAEEVAKAMFVISVVVLRMIFDPPEEAGPMEVFLLQAWSLVGRAILGQHPSSAAAPP